VALPSRRRAAGCNVSSNRQQLWRYEMPILLWLLGVPLVVVILLRVFGMI
jgi:hypothetical protein